MFDHVEDKTSIHEWETILDKEAQTCVQTLYQQEILKREKKHINCYHFKS